LFPTVKIWLGMNLVHRISVADFKIFLTTFKALFFISLKKINLSCSYLQYAGIKELFEINFPAQNVVKPFLFQTTFSLGNSVEVSLLTDYNGSQLKLDIIPHEERV
jgi:hypothetical protein